MKVKYFLLLILFPVLTFSQVQIGVDIDVELEDDYVTSTALSSDGTTIVIGAQSSWRDGNTQGHVRVFKNQSGIWTQIGEDIDGEVSNSDLGRSVSISSDGSIIALSGYFQIENSDSYSGRVQVFEFKEENWTQIGSDIIEVDNGSFGESISLNNNGNIIAIGAPQSIENTGHVKIYENQSGVWTQVGQNIVGKVAGDLLGYSIFLNGDGNILAAGGRFKYNNIDNERRGLVRVYENQSGVWTQIGLDIVGEAEQDQLGFSISMNYNGDILAIGIPGSDKYRQNGGYVQVYQDQSGMWVKKGYAINAEAYDDYFGVSVSLNEDGSILAAGSTENDSYRINAGHIRVFSFQDESGIWKLVGSEINGKRRSDRFGSRITLSSTGSIIVASSRDQVRVYDLSAVLSTKSFEKNYFSYYPNPVKDILNIDLNLGLNLKQINIYNIQSQYLYSVKTSKIDVSNLQSGMYFIEVETNQGKSAKKIVVE